MYAQGLLTIRYMVRGLFPWSRFLSFRVVCILVRAYFK